MNDLGAKNLQKLLLSLWCVLMGWKLVEKTGQNGCNCLNGIVLVREKIEVG